MKRYIFTESQVKTIIDKVINGDKKEIKPGVDLGKSFEKMKKNETPNDKETEKKPFSANKLKSEKK